MELSISFGYWVWTCYHLGLRKPDWSVCPLKFSSRTLLLLLLLSSFWHIKFFYFCWIFFSFSLCRSCKFSLRGWLFALCDNKLSKCKCIEIAACGCRVLLCWLPWAVCGSVANFSSCVGILVVIVGSLERGDLSAYNQCCYSLHHLHLMEFMVCLCASLSDGGIVCQSHCFLIFFSHTCPISFPFLSFFSLSLG